MTGISLEISVFINAPVEKVWDALVNPELIKKYLFGTTEIYAGKKEVRLFSKVNGMEKNIWIKVQY